MSTGMRADSVRRLLKQLNPSPAPINPESDLLAVEAGAESDDEESKRARKKKKKKSKKATRDDLLLDGIPDEPADVNAEY